MRFARIRLLGTLTVGLLLCCGLPALAQQEVNSVPIQSIQPFDPNFPITQKYCSPNQIGLGVNLEEWQPASGLPWNDPMRTRTPRCYIDCNGQLHCAGSCSSAFSSGCTGAGTGTVTSVGLALPLNVFAISGSPVTTFGTLTGTFIPQSPGNFFRSPAIIPGVNASVIQSVICQGSGTDISSSPCTLLGVSTGDQIIVTEDYTDNNGAISIASSAGNTYNTVSGAGCLPGDQVCMWVTYSAAGGNETVTVSWNNIAHVHYTPILTMMEVRGIASLDVASRSALIAPPPGTLSVTTSHANDLMIVVAIAKNQAPHGGIVLTPADLTTEDEKVYIAIPSAAIIASGPGGAPSLYTATEDYTDGAVGPAGNYSSLILAAFGTSATPLAALPVFGPLVCSDFPPWVDMRCTYNFEVTTGTQTTNQSGAFTFSGAVPPAGVYAVSGYMEIMTPNTAGNLDVAIAWTDNAANSQTATNGTLGAPADISTSSTNVAQIPSIIVQADGTHAVTWSFNITQTSGTASYQGFLTFVRLQ
jgi:hypothetical protein